MPVLVPMLVLTLGSLVLILALMFLLMLMPADGGGKGLEADVYNAKHEADAAEISRACTGLSVVTRAARRVATTR
jgi:hypothetical protein